MGKTEDVMKGFVFSVWGYEKSLFPVDTETYMKWTERNLILGFELNILTDEYWKTLVEKGEIEDIPLDKFYDTYMKRLSCGQPMTDISESMFKVAIDKAMPFAVYATLKHYAKYQYGNYWHISNMRPRNYDIETVVKSFHDTSNAWRSAARYFYRNGEDADVVKFCTLQALNTLKMGVQLILSNEINPYTPYITSSWKEVWENKNLDQWTKINSTLYSDMSMWGLVLSRFGVKPQEHISDDMQDNSVRLDEKCYELHNMLMQTCIDYCKKNNLIVVDDIEFHADGLQESIGCGEWTPATDSSLSLSDGEYNRIATSL